MREVLSSPSQPGVSAFQRSPAAGGSIQCLQNGLKAFGPGPAESSPAGFRTRSVTRGPVWPRMLLAPVVWQLRVAFGATGWGTKQESWAGEPPLTPWVCFVSTRASRSSLIPGQASAELVPLVGSSSPEKAEQFLLLFHFGETRAGISADPLDDPIPLACSDPRVEQRRSLVGSTGPRALVRGCCRPPPRARASGTCAAGGAEERQRCSERAGKRSRPTKKALSRSDSTGNTAEKRDSNQCQATTSPVHSSQCVSSQFWRGKTPLTPHFPLGIRGMNHRR